jgi:hypothetical protein
MPSLEVAVRADEGSTRRADDITVTFDVATLGRQT